jgi:3-carboxy-cis,cis-muconate cycloisomerase
MSESGVEYESGEVGLFDGVLARGPVRLAVGDHARLSAMLDVEAALARAQARVGIIPAAAADAIVAACRPGDIDIGALGRRAADTGNPVVALVEVLSARLDRSATQHLHYGATSQDILDTSLMLVTRQALDLLLVDLEAAADAAAQIAVGHRATLIAARTLLQQALPTTFGAKAAGWLAGLDAAAARLYEVRRSRLAVQLGGAAGTLAALGQDGPRVLAVFAAELELAEPVAPWHAERTRIADVAGALGTASVAIAKPALDVILLAQTEIGEVREGTPVRGRSSSLPQKRNPVAAVAARACAAQAPGLVATLLAAGVGEHERAAGPWHAEWRPMAELLRSVGSAAAWLRDCLEHLVVDPVRMRTNLERSGGLILAERVAGALAPGLGRAKASWVVAAAAAAAIDSGQPLGDVLARDPAVAAHLDRGAIDRLLDMGDYLGSAGAFVDRALAARGTRRPVPEEVVP